jgi:hypothetical protein
MMGSMLCFTYATCTAVGTASEACDVLRLKLRPPGLTDLAYQPLLLPRCSNVPAQHVTGFLAEQPQCMQACWFQIYID